jgi:molybdopterin-synthase adenylyltransferase
MRRVIIVGVGALGSHVVQFMRSVPDCSLTVIDFDRVEAKNTLSQFHAKASVGKGKVQSLQQTMSFLFGHKLAIVPHRLTGDNVEALLDGAHLVVDCLDNAASRELVQRFVRGAGIPCLHGALAADGGFGRVVWDPHFVIDAETDAGAATCEDGGHLPFIALTAGYLAWAAQRFLRSGDKAGVAVHPGGANLI